MSEQKEQPQEKKSNSDEHQKWFKKEDLQDLAKLGGGFLKKTMASGMDAFKEVKDHLPKDATSLLQKGKEELLKGLSQETAKNIVSFSVEKIFKVASQYSLEFSIRIRRHEDGAPVVKKGLMKK